MDFNNVTIAVDEYTFHIDINFKRFIREFEIRNNIVRDISIDLDIKEYHALKLLYVFNIEYLLEHIFENNKSISVNELVNRTSEVLQKEKKYDVACSFVVSEMINSLFYSFIAWVNFVSLELEKLDKTNKTKIKNALKQTVVDQIKQTIKDNE